MTNCNDWLLASCLLSLLSGFAKNVNQNVPAISLQIRDSDPSNITKQGRKRPLDTPKRREREKERERKKGRRKDIEREGEIRERERGRERRREREG